MRSLNACGKTTFIEKAALTLRHTENTFTWFPRFLEGETTWCIHCYSYNTTQPMRVKETAPFGVGKAFVYHMVSTVWLLPDAHSHTRQHTLKRVSVTATPRKIHVSRKIYIRPIDLLFGSFARTSHANAVLSIFTRSFYLCVPFLDGTFKCWIVSHKLRNVFK